MHDEHECALYRAGLRPPKIYRLRRLLTQLCKFLVARIAGAKVIQPLVDLCEP
jgi:hypothetical protein